MISWTFSFARKTNNQFVVAKTISFFSPIAYTPEGATQTPPTQAFFVAC
jgi:hypothetical protein